MTNLKRLHTELKALSSELFQGHAFAILDESDPKVIRYNQLFQFFHPSFRTKDYIDPLAEEQQVVNDYELYYI